MAIGGLLAQTCWEHAGKLNCAELVAIADYDAIVQGPHPRISISFSACSMVRR